MWSRSGMLGIGADRFYIMTNGLQIAEVLGGSVFVNIETKRLLLKCVEQSDREFIFEEFQNEFINRFLFDEEPMTVIEQADDLINFYNLDEPRNQNRWVLINKDENIKMGTCGFHLWDREKNKVEIGFELMPQFTRKGFMAEAVEAMIEFAQTKMNANKLIAIVSIDNSQCKRLLEKFGFFIIGKEECMFKESIYLHDIYELELLKA
jgi:ribosomal-protein-alanine N-acetyltransferase